MKTRSVLLYLPALPFRVEALFPQRELAVVAGALLEEGHQTEIWDYGVVEEVARAKEGMVGGRTRVWLRARHEAERRSQLVQRLCRERGLDFVAILAQTHADMVEALHVGRALRRAAPRIRQFLFGEHAVSFQAVLASAGDWDAVCTEESLAQLARVFGSPPQWGSVHGVCTGIPSAAPAARTPGFCGAFVLPEYSEEVYGAMAGAHKFRLFAVPRRGPQTGARHYDSPAPRAAVPGAAWRHSVEEVQWIQRQWGARVFYLRGRFGTLDLLQGLNALSCRGSGLVLGTECDLDYMDEEAADLLARFGCSFVSVDVDSGSQRLLEEFYGRRFGLSKAEQLLRGLRGAGVHIHARLQFPCAEDDYHTRAETVRFLSRAGVSTVELTAPKIRPGSVWRQRADEFGFILQPRRHADWCRGEEEAAWRRRAPGYRLRGWGRRRKAAEREHLLCELAERGIQEAPAAAGLLARVSSRIDSEQSYLEGLHGCLTNFDAEAIYAMIRGFNDAASSSTVTSVVQRRDEMRTAVGN